MHRAANMNSLNHPVHTVLLLVIVCTVYQCCAMSINNRPIIGILTKPTTSFEIGQEYIQATYVHYLEMAGARVVPVRGKQPLAYYEKLFENINGVFFPGGSASPVSGPYFQSANYLYDMAIKANDAGDYFPVWGTCLGFEELTVLTANKNYLQHTDTENLTMPLRLVKGFQESRLFKDMPKDIRKYLETEPVTQNNHHDSLLLKDFGKISALHKFYRLISTNAGRDGKEFVSTVEAYKYPFYGVQWHPEKNVFLWQTDQAIDHNAHAIKVSQYFADFFVSEARKSLHHYDSTNEEAHEVIENYHREFFPDFAKAELYFFNYTQSYFLEKYGRHKMHFTLSV